MAAKSGRIPAETVESIRRAQVESELERILGSPGFRTSKRSQEFLRYIVQTSLDGRFDDLKERVIGNQVFQRCPDYDTGEHSIVRVKANELRKRLAQFYGESVDLSSVQIHLPRGSYTPEFRWPVAIVPQAPAEQLTAPRVSPRHRLVMLLGGAALLLAVCAGLFLLHSRRAADVETLFWNPMLQDASQPMICVADPEVLRLDDKYNALAFHGILPAYVPTSELVRDSNHYVGWGDAVALSQLSTFFALRSKSPAIRTGNDISFAELSKFPVILIGARSNPWTVQLANNLRFVFERSDTESYIRDNTDPTKKWTFQLGTPKVDYVVVTRILESKTGRMVVLAAGLSHFGTQVAGEILTNPVYLRRALRNAPHDWERRNLQLVFRVEVFGDMAGTPTLEASTFW